MEGILRFYIVAGIMAMAGGFTGLAVNALGMNACLSVLVCFPVGVGLMALYDYDGEIRRDDGESW